jgi:tripartite ATP-independent transporter DctP family solute receptor
MAFFIRIWLLAACLVLIALPVEAREFRAAETQVPDYPTVEGLRHMGKLLSERTKGRLTLKVFPNAALGQERDTIEQLKIGGVDMIRLSAAPLNNIVPESIVPSLPYIFRSEEHMHAVLDGPIGDEILAAMEKQGIVGLAWYDDGPRSLYTKKPVKTLADVKGMKIRVQQSDMFVAMVQALGASPTPLPYGEVYTALTTGIIDGAENSMLSYETSRHFEVAKHYTLTEHSLLPSVVVFSKVIWDRLPKEDQALIRQAAKDSVPYMRGLLKERFDKAKQTVEATGVQVTPVNNKQEFVDAVVPIYEKFATTPTLKNLIDRIQATQ